MSDPLSTSLNLRPIEEIKPKQIELVRSDQRISDQSLEDFDTAKTHLENIMDLTEPALEDVIRLARASQSDKLYKAAAEFINSVRQVNKDFVDLTKTKQELFGRQTDEQSPDGTVINNTYNQMVVNSNDLLDEMIAFKEEIELKRIQNKETPEES